MCGGWRLGGGGWCVMSREWWGMAGVDSGSVCGGCPEGDIGWGGAGQTCQDTSHLPPPRRTSDTLAPSFNAYGQGHRHQYRHGPTAQVHKGSEGVSAPHTTCARATGTMTARAEDRAHGCRTAVGGSDLCISGSLEAPSEHAHGLVWGGGVFQECPGCHCCPISGTRPAVAPSQTDGSLHQGASKGHLLIHGAVGTSGAALTIPPIAPVWSHCPPTHMGLLSVRQHEVAGQERGARIEQQNFRRGNFGTNLKTEIPPRNFPLHN